jgi:restriction system protein
MAKQSLFSILSGQPWWVSLLVAATLFALLQVFLPPLAPFIALPFVAVAVYVAWKQLHGASPANVEERLAALRAMPRENFELVISEAYRRQGYTVEESRGGAFDFRLRKDNRSTLVQCRRWKVNQAGVKPVQELHEAMNKLEASNGVCITAGEFSASAREFAAGKPIVLLNHAALTDLVGTIEKTRRRWFSS